MIGGRRKRWTTCPAASNRRDHFRSAAAGAGTRRLRKKKCAERSGLQDGLVPARDTRSDQHQGLLMATRPFDATLVDFLAETTTDLRVGPGCCLRWVMQHAAGRKHGFTWRNVGVQRKRLCSARCDVTHHGPDGSEVFQILSRSLPNGPEVTGAGRPGLRHVFWWASNATTLGFSEGLRTRSDATSSSTRDNLRLALAEP